MAKSKEKNKALELRQQGESVGVIAKKIGIAKSTVSLWCRDIKLTPAQIKHLRDKMILGSYYGRMKGARMQYERRLRLTKKLQEEGRRRIGLLSPRNFMIAGVALYWGEGTKKDRQGVRLINSDPAVIKFMLKWFKRVWGISNDRIKLAVIINRIHKNRVEEVEGYWSKITRIPRDQFTKTTLIKAKNKKNYKNFPVHFGTLTIKIKKSTNLHRQISGMIDALRTAA